MREFPDETKGVGHLKGEGENLKELFGDIESFVGEGAYILWLLENEVEKALEDDYPQFIFPPSRLFEGLLNGLELNMLESLLLF